MVISGHSIARDTPAEGPPGPDVNIGGRLLGITTTLIALCLLVFGLRIAIRLRSKVRLRWDDRIMTLAMVCPLPYFLYAAWMKRN